MQSVASCTPEFWEQRAEQMRGRQTSCTHPEIKEKYKNIITQAKKNAEFWRKVQTLKLSV